MRGFIKRGLVFALASLMLCGSCASAISVDSDYALEYLYKEKMYAGKKPVYYGYENGLYVFNCIFDEKYYAYAVADRSSDDQETLQNIDFWKVQKIVWQTKTQESKDLLDQSGLTDESVMGIVSCNISKGSNPVYVPLFIYKDGVLIYDIGDSMQPTE